MRLLTRLALAGRRWQQWVPLVQSLKGYSRADFSSDLSAGVVVGMVSYRAGKRSGGSSTYESLA